MKDINTSIENLRLKYREIFKFSSEEIQKRIDELKPPGVSDLLSDYPLNSVGYLWQKQVLNMLENEISKDIYSKWMELLEHRKNYSCACCGVCCNLACSEFSYEQLLEKAKNGDNFAKQFTSIFVPYENIEDAQKIYPEYIKMLEKNKEEQVYFYHCPKINSENKCSDYEHRPKICRDFPDNPLALLPVSCGYCEWKESTEPVALMLHSMLQIVEYYKENLNLKL